MLPASNASLWLMQIKILPTLYPILPEGLTLSLSNANDSYFEILKPCLTQGHSNETLFHPAKQNRNSIINNNRNANKLGKRFIIQQRKGNVHSSQIDVLQQHTIQRR